MPQKQSLTPKDILFVDDIERDVDFAQPLRPLEQKGYEGAQAEVKLVVNAEGQKAARKALKEEFQSKVLELYGGKNYAEAELDLLETVSGRTHLPQFLGAAETRQQLFLFYAPWAKFNLRDWILDPKQVHGQNARFLTIRQAGIQVLLCLTRTLHELHDTRPPIMHRDIKPENVCLTDDGTILLVDFGVGRLCKATTVCKSYVGTERYMAPEVFSPDAMTGYSRPSEVFSLGAVFAEVCVVLAGCRVAEGLHAEMQNKPFAKSRRALEKYLGQIVALDNTLKPLVDLTLRMLSMSAKERPRMWEVHADLLDFGKRTKWVAYTCCASEIVRSNLEKTPSPPEELNTGGEASMVRFDFAEEADEAGLQPSWGL
ncbi:Phosphorylase b kinase gamma catalytic chain, skeletal muscle/heart isoform [Borealophlyctis nickersoniae]|nr:Phosphorylase b kinase gamma catalytic chain, skeletal muscle/heart isoform [Borealophlyctis nickersoniae]